MYRFVRDYALTGKELAQKYADLYIFKREKIFIVPTLLGAIYIVILLVTFSVGLLMEHSLLHLFGFLLFTLFLVGMLQTNNNMLGVEVTQAEPSFTEAGAPVILKLKVVNQSRDEQALARFSLRVQKQKLIAALGKNSHEYVTITLPPKKRGVYILPRIRVATEFPIGLFYSWKSFTLPAEYVVYPTPILSQKMESAFHSEEEDFTEHKPYVLGESENRIDCKAYARTGEKLLKQFKDTRLTAVELDFFALRGLDSELRLSQMTHALLKAREQKRACSIVLPDFRLKAGNTPDHYARCLTALAAFRGRS